MTAREIDISEGGESEFVATNADVQKGNKGLPAKAASTALELPDGPEGIQAPQDPNKPPLLHLDPEQQQAAVQMTHYLNSLMCMVSEHFTSLERYILSTVFL